MFISVGRHSINLDQVEGLEFNDRSICISMTSGGGYLLWNADATKDKRELPSGAVLLNASDFSRVKQTLQKYIEG